MLDWLASILIRILASTWRIHVEGTIPKQRCIVAFWHGEMLPVWYVMRTQKPTALVSASRDGSYLSRLLTDWGYTVIRGSSSKGGSDAMVEIVSALQLGMVLVTPDGPRGPIHQCKPGVVVAAQRSQVPIVLVRVYTSRSQVFGKSWDKFVVPTLFSHITIHLSHEITVDAELSREEVNVKIRDVEHQLNTLGSVVC